MDRGAYRSSLVFFRQQLLDNSAGVAGRHTVGGNVVGHHATGSNDSTVANRHTGADGDIAAQPAILSNNNGIGRLNGLAPLQVVDGVLRGVERTIGSNECAVADGDVARIEKHTVVVDEDAFAQVQAVAVVAVEGWKDGD